MTQKELLYVEDAISHEKIVLDVLDDNRSLLEDRNLVKSLDKEISIHQEILDNLNQLLEDKSNE